MSRANRELCNQVSPECPLEWTTYGYYPKLSVNSFFVALFGLLCILQIGIGRVRKTWTYMLAMTIATFGEAVGYGESVGSGWIQNTDLLSGVGT